MVPARVPNPAVLRFVLPAREWFRRPGSWVEFASWAALALFVIVGIGLPLIGIGTFLNTGLLSRFAPWTDVMQWPKLPSNILDSDTVDSAAPQVALLVRLAHEGVFGQWNPYLAGGTELGGLPDSGAYSPLSLPWWILPFGYAAGIVKLLEVVVVTVGMSLLLRRWGVPRAAWPIAALVFSSSGFMVAWTNWPQTRVAAFIPLLFWGIDRAAVELKARDILSVGLPLMGMLLGGFPAVVGYTLFIAAPYFVVRAVIAHRDAARGVGRAVGRFVVSGLITVGGLAFGVLASAWQLVPFAYNAATVIDFGVRGESGGSGRLGLAPLLTSYLPDIISFQSHGQAWAAGNPVESYSYIGMAAAVLIAAAVLVRQRKPQARGIVGLLVVLLFVSIVLVYFGGPLLALVEKLPVFDSNPVGRMRSVVGFLAAALAGIGFGRLVDGRNLRDELASWREAGVLRWVWRGLVALVVLALAVAVAYETRLALYAVPGAFTRFLYLETAATAVIAIAAAAAVAAVWLLRRRWIPVAAGVVVAALVAGPAAASVTQWWPKSPDATIYPQTPAISYLEKHLGDQQRYVTVGQVTLPGTGSYYQLRSLGGHTFQTTQWKQLLTAIDPKAYVTPTYSSLSPDDLQTAAVSPLMDRLAVKYIVSDPSFPIVGTTEAGAKAAGTTELSGGHPSISTASFTGPVRGLSFTGPSTAAAGPKGLELSVAIVADAGGATLAKTTTWVQQLSGVRDVALEGESISAGTSWHAVITVTGESAPLGVAETSAGTAAVDLVRPADDGLSIVHTGDATIYARSGADDRVHWASTARVVTSEAARVAELKSAALPASTVLLSAPAAGASTATPASTRSAAAATATVHAEPTGDRVDETVAHVDAAAAGWLVVEDSLQRPGWSATVDGKPAQLVAADNAGGAVRVPAGEHTVVLRYETPGLRAGLLLTGATFLGAVVIVLLWLLRRRRSAVK